MLDTTELLAWLRATNQRYSSEGVPHRLRPFHAMRDFIWEHKISVGMNHPISRQIFDWFYENSPPGAHEIGSLYTSVFLYDTAFWPVYVPFIFGEVRVSPLTCLETMPDQVKRALEESPRDFDTYVDHWKNCMTYGYGRQVLSGANLQPRTSKLLEAAHSELVGANAQLLETRPNVKAILGLRMATEIFLKAVLVQERNLAEGQLMKLSHRLQDAANACSEATGEKVFEEVGRRASLFPPVSARYDNVDWSSSSVWAAAALTQLTASMVIRLYASRREC